MIFGGRASHDADHHRPTAAILHRGLLEVHPQLAGYRIEYAWGGNVGFTFDRMPHVGPDQGRRDVRGGLLRHRRRADDLPGTRVGEWLAGGEAPALAKLTLPARPAPYEGRPWFLPFAGEWFRLQDRLAARSKPKPKA